MDKDNEPIVQLSQTNHLTAYQMGAPVVQQLINFGPKAQQLICPSCHEHIKSTKKSQSTTKTHLLALLLCVCCCWPCVCLPYCMDSCQNITHYCPNCKIYLGAYQN